MRKGLLIILLAGIFGAIGLVFWLNEWKYSLPTPVPGNYRVVPMGAYVDLSKMETLRGFRNPLRVETAKPLFLHFFNPACPCSKFNIPHFRSLAHQYGNKMDFAIVVLSKDTNYSVED